MGKEIPSFFNEMLWLVFLSLQLSVLLLFEDCYYSRAAFISLESLPTSTTATSDTVTTVRWCNFVRSKRSLLVLLSVVETSHTTRTALVPVRSSEVICIRVHVTLCCYYSRVVTIRGRCLFKEIQNAYKYAYIRTYIHTYIYIHVYRYTHTWTASD